MSKKKQKAIPAKANDTEIQPGETMRFMCDNCGTEFEVCLEPKVEPDMDTGLEAKTVGYCPFCCGSAVAPC